MKNPKTDEEILETEWKKSFGGGEGAVSVNVKTFAKILMAKARQAEQRKWLNDCEYIPAREKEAFEKGKIRGDEQHHHEEEDGCKECTKLFEKGKVVGREEGFDEGKKTWQLVCEEKKAAIKHHLERIKALEADKEIQATELRGKINEISVLSAKIRKLEAALDKIANASAISKDNNQDYWEAKKIAKEALGNCGSASGIGNAVGLLPQSEARTVGIARQPHSKKKVK